MQQVLEAPQIQDAELISTAGDYPPARSHKREARSMGTAEKTHSRLIWLRSMVSAFTKPTSYYIPQCADTRPHDEAALDPIYRIDPYLYIKSLAG